jgi:hypothetical protein
MADLVEPARGAAMPVAHLPALHAVRARARGSGSVVPEPVTTDHLEPAIETKAGPQLGPDVAAARRLLEWHCDSRGDQLSPGESVHQELRYPGAHSPHLFRAGVFFCPQDDQGDVVLWNLAVPLPQFPRRPAFDRLPQRNPPVLRLGRVAKVVEIGGAGLETW